MSAQTIETQIHLPKKQYDMLDKQAKELQSTVPDIIQSVLTKYFKKTEHPLTFTKNDPLRQMVANEDGAITDGSIKHDYYIYDEPETYK